MELEGENWSIHLTPQKKEKKRERLLFMKQPHKSYHRIKTEKFVA